MNWGSFPSTTLGAVQASIAVILVLVYGYASRAYNLLTQLGEENLSKFTTVLCLPALLFSQMGPQADASTLATFWPIVALALLTQSIGFTYAYLGRRIFPSALPFWVVGACMFNNSISLPLLMVDSLGHTGALDDIIGQGGTNDALQRTKSYLLVNALIYNLTRFSVGPKVLSNHDQGAKEESSSLSQPHPDVHCADLEDQDTERTPLLSIPQQRHPRIRRIWEKLKGALNPPLVGGLLAIFVGLIPPLHHIFLDDGGFLKDNLTQSIEKVGHLYPVLQMLVVGAKLRSSARGSYSLKVPIFAMVYVLAFRFVFMPAFSISFVYAIRRFLPNLVHKDPMLDFVLMIAPVGPPAMSLAAVAQLANLSQDEHGVIARVLTISYMVTPLISVPIAAAVAVVKMEGLKYERWSL